jgi:lysophospholipase L1-like esterase
MRTALTFLFILILLPGCNFSKKQERWLVLGDSITMGGHYVDYVETWLLLNEENAPEIIDLGLGSETVSGLSEPDHPFPRPCLIPRLESVLERVQPDVVIACYGMNCGIYHPFSEDRFKAYQDGINELIDQCQSAGAEVILVTPPPFAGRVKPKSPPAEGEPYGFKTPASDYNEVLGRYADWILSLDGKNGIRSIMIRPAIERFMEKCYPKEPVHPNEFGHELIGEAILWQLGYETGSDLLETGINPWSSDPEWTGLLELVEKQRLTYDRSLLNDIGHGNPGVMKRATTPLAEAEKEAELIQSQIDELLSR